MIRVDTASSGYGMEFRGNKMIKLHFPYYIEKCHRLEFDYVAD